MEIRSSNPHNTKMTLLQSPACVSQTLCLILSSYSLMQFNVIMKISAKRLKQLSMTKSKLSPAYGSLAGRYNNPLPEVSLFPPSADAVFCSYSCTATKIPFMYFQKRFVRPQSQFPHSFVYERFIYSKDGSINLCAAE